MDTGYKMLKIQSTGTCIREYRRIHKQWIQDTKYWRYKVQDPVSKNTGEYLNNGYRIQNVEDMKYKIQDTRSCIREYRRIYKQRIQDTKCWRYKVENPVSENTGGYLKNGYRIQNVEDTKYRNMYQRIQEDT